MSEEAYRTGRTPEFQGTAAVHRSLVGLDVNERILWLRRSNPADPEVKVLLSWDLADQALEHGDDDQANGHDREALADAMAE